MQITFASVRQKRRCDQQRCLQQQQSKSLELCPAATRYETTQRLKGRSSSTETLHAGRESVDGDLQRCSTSSSFSSSSPQKLQNHEHESQSPASRQPSVMQKPLASPHRCKVNHAVASQSVILYSSLRILDKPVAMACVRETCRSKGKEAWIGMQVYESGRVI